MVWRFHFFCLPPVGTTILQDASLRPWWLHAWTTATPCRLASWPVPSSHCNLSRMQLHIWCSTFPNSHITYHSSLAPRSNWYSFWVIGAWCTRPWGVLFPPTFSHWSLSIPYPDFSDRSPLASGLSFRSEHRVAASHSSASSLPLSVRGRMTFLRQDSKVFHDKTENTLFPTIKIKK